LPYARILERLVDTVPGATAALLLDGEGELVVAAGRVDERHRLMGAVGGISLGVARRVAARQGAGPLRHLVFRHEGGSVVLRPLKDGYYLVVSLGPGALVPRGVRHTEDAQRQLDEEI
jgi:predicted regulator of Ras-like GTPase activity (Roadblock/LC7/MglB family)